jgi:hypothetical protein
LYLGNLVGVVEVGIGTAGRILGLVLESGSLRGFGAFRSGLVFVVGILVG